jgi:hypothetical protein
MSRNHVSFIERLHIHILYKNSCWRAGATPPPPSLPTIDQIQTETVFFICHSMKTTCWIKKVLFVYTIQYNS